MPEAPEPPPGLVYRPGFITPEEERRVLDVLERVELHAVVMRGQASRRLVRHFGLDYGYESHELVATDPLPAELEWLRERCAALAEARPDELAQVLVTRYPAGAPIGWHRDAPMFGRVVGVSLASACRMRFQRGSGEERRVWELDLEARSAYVLRGAARWTWQHSIPPAKAERYSLTFRTLRNRGRERAP